jgi:hypothetical protein
MATDQFEIVANSGLRLRSEPEVTPGNIIATLPKGQLVTKLMEASDRDWWQVKTRFQGIDLTSAPSGTFSAFRINNLQISNMLKNLHQA